MRIASDSPLDVSLLDQRVDFGGSEKRPRRAPAETELSTLVAEGKTKKAAFLAPGAFQPSKNSIFAPWAVSAIKNNFRPSYKYEIESIRDFISERTQGQPQPGARYDTTQYNTMQQSITSKNVTTHITALTTRV